MRAIYTNNRKIRTKTICYIFSFIYKIIRKCFTHSLIIIIKKLFYISINIQKKS